MLSGYVRAKPQIDHVYLSRPPRFRACRHSDSARGYWLQHGYVSGRGWGLAEAADPRATRARVQASANNASPRRAIPVAGPCRPFSWLSSGRPIGGLGVLGFVARLHPAAPNRTGAVRLVACVARLVCSAGRTNHSRVECHAARICAGPG